MSKPVTTPIQTIVVPDTRFEQTFKNALKKEAKRMKAARLGITTLDDNAPVTPMVVAKVVVRDVFFMPLVQGVLWTSFLIAIKPWLRNAVWQGRRFGMSVYRLVLGKDLVRKRV